MTGFVLSPLAQADLRDIWDYTADKWGLDQAESYLRVIEAAIKFVAAEPQRGRTADQIRLGYRKYLAGTHVLFYRLSPQGVDIVRILHQRMDFDRHL